MREEVPEDDLLGMIRAAEPGETEGKGEPEGSEKAAGAEAAGKDRKTEE